MSSVDPLRIVANLTHELKTPLHAILSTASILDSEIDGELSSEQKKQVDIILRNGEHLLEMITSLLSYSSTMTTSRQLTISRIYPTDLLNNLFQEIQPLAVNRGIVCSFQSNSNNRQLYTDKELLIRIFSNIISNSIKFTKKSGSVEILINDLDSETVRIRIADSGVGMNLETKEQIFGAFFQADSSSTREYGGVGLGLSLVKVAADQIKAKIKVESELGRGSIFTIDVPNLKYLVRDKNLVLIGSDETLKSSLKMVLEDEGFSLNFIDIDDVPTGLIDLKPELFIVDGILGLEDLTILDKIRSLSNFDKVPALGILNSKDSKVRHMALEAGFAETISKPFDLKEILSHIKITLGKENKF